MSTTTPSTAFSVASVSFIYYVLGDVSFVLIWLALSRELVEQILTCTAAAVASAKRLRATEREKQRRATAQAISRLVSAEVESKTTEQIARLDDARRQFERQRRANAKLVANRIVEEIALIKERERAVREAREAVERAEQEARQAAERAEQEQEQEDEDDEDDEEDDEDDEEDDEDDVEEEEEEEEDDDDDDDDDDEARRAAAKRELEAAKARTAAFAKAEADRHRRENVKEKQALDEAKATAALQRALPHRILNLNPLGSGFSCVGVTKKKVRCGQLFISTENKSNGHRQWRTMISNSPGESFEMPALRQLASALLCPRWHKGIQEELVARAWYRELADAREALKVLQDVKARGVLLVDGTGDGGATLFGRPATAPQSTPSPFGRSSVSVESSPSVHRGGFASATSSPGQASVGSSSSICSDETPSLHAAEMVKAWFG